MADITRPESLSVYRGQARTGQGEGPGRGVTHGEQYMSVPPALYNDELLDAIRPWLTLDSDPADHQRLNDQLEGWSLFSAGNYVFVTRLASAGVYDRRAAYFAHARAWNISRLPPNFDPGTYLGRSDAFDQPWQHTPVAPVREDAALLWPEQVKGDPDTAARFLGHLLQAMVEGYPVIIAAPIGSFVSRGALHGMVSFSRGGLPSKLRNDCRIRIYSRHPELFLRHLGTHLLVVPEDTAGNAMAARPGATLLDQHGRRVAGKDLDDRSRDYGAAVVERAIAIPDGLPYFSERFQRLMWKGVLPTAEDSRAVQITYNVAYAWAGTPERRAEMLRKYLPRAAAKLRSGFDWDRLIAAEEWRDFPPDAIMDQLLTDTRDISEAGREFLCKVEDGASRLGLKVDDRLSEWWDPDDEAKVQRLVELLGHGPPLVNENAVAQRTAGIPIGRLAQIHSLSEVLNVEAKSGTLARRTHESAQLAVLAKDQKVFEVLSLAVANGRIDTGWARIYVGTAGLDAATEAGRAWAERTHFFTTWGEVPRELLERLQSLRAESESLVPLATMGLRLNPTEDLKVYLLSADLLARINKAAGRSPDSRPMAALRNNLQQMPDSDVAYLEDILFDLKWSFPELNTIDLLLLLQLAPRFKQDAHFDQLYQELDARVRKEAEATTETLTRSGWWYFWRSRTRLSAEDGGDVLERSASAWLTSNAWSSGEEEPTIEAWERAMADLPLRISGEKMAELRGDGGLRRQPWPWIPPFEKDQLARFIDRAGDLGALAEIAEAVEADDSAPALTTPVYEFVLQKSGFAQELPANALNWLSDEQWQAKPHPLTLTESKYLFAHSGHREKQAIKARIEAISERLKLNSQEALKAASTPHLWSDGRFLSAVAGWMNERGSLSAIGDGAAKWIEKQVNGEATRRPRSPSRTLIEELVAAGYECAAGLLDPAMQATAHQETVADFVMEALIKGRVNENCWQRLEDDIKAKRSPHPVTVLANRIRRDDVSFEQREKLAKNGWRTFETVAETYPQLMYTPPQSEDVPVFNLATSLLGPGTLGTAAILVIDTPRNQVWRDNAPWWQCLLRSIRDFRRYDGLRSADDRQGYAIALVRKSVDVPKERKALDTALRLEAKNNPEWEILNEFV